MSGLRHKSWRKARETKVLHTHTTRKERNKIDPPINQKLVVAASSSPPPFSQIVHGAKKPHCSLFPSQPLPPPGDQFSPNQSLCVSLFSISLPTHARKHSFDKGRRETKESCLSSSLLPHYFFPLLLSGPLIVSTARAFVVVVCANGRETTPAIWALKIPLGSVSAVE